MSRFGPLAYYDGQDWPRCQDRPTAAEEDDQPEMTVGTWECALPAGHGDFDKPRVHPHSWAQTGD